MTNQTINPNIELWDCSEDAEELHHYDQRDAIEAYLDQALYKVPIDQWPKTVTVYGFARMEVKDSRLPDIALEAVIERLDEEYGSPDEETTITPEMETAAQEFIKKILAEYTVWSCERKTSADINVMDWVKENAPNWLEPESQNPIPLYKGEGDVNAIVESDER